MRWFGVALLVLGSACADESATDELRGSVSQVYDLSFDTVRARLDDEELAIQFVDGRQVPVQVVVRITELPLTGPATVDLARYGAVLGQRDSQRIPPLVSGELILADYEPLDGAVVEGRFDAVVDTGDQSLTVVGRFSTTLEEIP